MNYPPKQAQFLFSRASNFLTSLLNLFKMREYSFILTIAVLIGLFGGFGAVLIQLIIKMFEHFFWGASAAMVTFEQTVWFWKLIIPTLGGVFVGLVIQFIAKEAKGHGVPEVMEAISLRNGIIRPRVVLAKLIASAVCIASGGSVGREGPVVQVGSATGSTIGQLLGVNARRMRIFVACGAASGIAAAFNAPVAGALFSVEVILGDFAVAQFSPVVVSSVVATVISRGFLGDFPAFQVPKYHLGSPVELFFYLVLGFLAAGAALLFINTLYSTEGFFDKLKWPEPFKTGLGGLAIGAIGLVFPQIFGIGYDTLSQALQSGLVLKLAVVLIFVKIMATSLSLGSGGSGGIFSPSLFIGAALGSSFGSLLALVFPNLEISPGAYALVAMGGVVAAATHGPITGIVIIFEMSGDYKIILPLMITCIIATLLAVRIKEESIYTLKLKLRGINLYGGREINVLKSLTVNDVYKKSIEIVNESELFPNIVEKIANSKHPLIYVINNDQKICGCISLNEIRQTIIDYENLKNLLIARDVMNPEVITVTLDEDLDTVMKKFGRYGNDLFPVITAGTNHQIVGTVWQQDVIEVYNRQIFLRDMSGEIGSGIRKADQQKYVPIYENYNLLEIEAPIIFIGKTLRQLNLRSKYGIQVILIKKKTNSGYSSSFLPVADYKIETGDMLLVFGEKVFLNKLEKL
jgi:CIC family chloride channel protein